MTHTTFIHTSDLQLGMRRKFLSLEAQSRFDDARLRAVTRLGEIAQDRGAEFIVVAGDVFEHNSLEPTTLGRALEALRKLPVPVYLLPGNHDPLVADSIFQRTGISRPRSPSTMVSAPIVAAPEMPRPIINPATPAGSSAHFAARSPMVITT